MMRRKLPSLAKMGEGGSYLSSLSPPFSIFFHSPPSSLNPVSICFTPFLLPPLSHPFFIPPFFDLAPNVCFFLGRSRVKPSATTGGCRRKRDLIVVPFPAPRCVHCTSLYLYLLFPKERLGGRRKKEEETGVPGGLLSLIFPETIVSA